MNPKERIKEYIQQLSEIEKSLDSVPSPNGNQQLFTEKSRIKCDIKAWKDKFKDTIANILLDEYLKK